MYKLTNQDMQTYNGFQWEIGKWYEIENPNTESELCTNRWFHFYSHPLLAVLLNPIHANISNPRLFKIKVDGHQKDDNGLKGGCTRMRLVKEMEIPDITIEQWLKFGICCALEVYKDKNFARWAENWLSGKDRRAAGAAWAAAGAAAEATWAAAEAAGAAARADTIDLVTLAKKALEE